VRVNVSPVPTHPVGEHARNPSVGGGAAVVPEPHKPAVPMQAWTPIAPRDATMHARQPSAPSVHYVQAGSVLKPVTPAVTAPVRRTLAGIKLFQR
jgi:hypothetical protein